MELLGKPTKNDGSDPPAKKKSLYAVDQENFHLLDPYEIPMKILTNECSVARALPATCPGLWVPISAPQSHSVLPPVSQLQYKEQCYRATPVSTTPEIERVRRNQEQLSTASCFCFLISYQMLPICILHSAL